MPTVLVLARLSASQCLLLASFIILTLPLLLLYQQQEQVPLMFAKRFSCKAMKLSQHLTHTSPIIYVPPVPLGWDGNLLDANTKCVISQCFEDIPRANAVIVHGCTVLQSDLHRLQLLRRPSQLFVYLNNESPQLPYRFSLSRFNGIFNRTMMYRRDADYVYPYGGLEKGSSPAVNLSKKQKSVLWIVSNCSPPNQRASLAEKLMDAGLKVDQYGRCNNRRIDDRMAEELAAEYKFYLAFENSNCLDYVTEKVFKYLELGLVPIVYGAANYTEVFGNIPHKVVIDVRDFKSPKHLVEHINYLETNSTAYEEYFEWRKNYRILPRAVTGERAINALCNELHSRVIQQKVYWNMPEEYKDKGRCHTRLPHQYE